MNETTRSTDQNIAAGFIIGSSFFSFIVNCFIFSVFIVTAELRKNLFYRLLFLIYLYHAIASIVTISRYVQFYIDFELNFMCTLSTVLGSASRTASITQTAIVALDRYMTVTAKSKADSLQRRRRTGILSTVIIISTFIFYTVVGFVSSNGSHCSTGRADPYGALSNVISRITSNWILICIFLIEVPLCLSTLIMIRKSVKRTGVHMPQQEPPKQAVPVLQNSKLKWKAVRVLLLIIVGHVAVFVPQIILLLIYQLYSKAVHKDLYDYGVLVQIISFMIDAMICFLTIKPFQVAYQKCYRERKCFKWWPQQLQGTEMMSINARSSAGKKLKINATSATGEKTQNRCHRY